MLSDLSRGIGVSKATMKFNGMFGQAQHDKLIK